LNVKVILQEVFDLTDQIAQIALETNVQEFTGDRESYQIRNIRTPVSYPTGIAPTQELGKALFATGVEDFRAISAKVPWQKILTVFIDNLQTGSSLTFTDSSGAIRHRIP
jgi:hypothetical protein